MNRRILISENEREGILKLYNIVEDTRTPLQRLMECKFTSDGKYVVFEGVVYSSITGERAIINENWFTDQTLSDYLHYAGDALSVAADFALPGSGAVVDALNAFSYIIEGEFKTGREKDGLYLMAAMSFGLMSLVGPLQALAIPIKNAIKTGKGLGSKVVVDGLKILKGSIDTVLVKIPSLINNALKSPLAAKILGKWGNKISTFITNFTKRVKELFSQIPSLSPEAVSKTKAITNNASKNLVKPGTEMGLEYAGMGDVKNRVLDYRYNTVNRNKPQ